MTSLQHTFYSHGKLLLTGEYAVLDGAFSLAIPTALGQRLDVFSSENNALEWQSYDLHGECWFSGNLFQNKPENQLTETLERILATAIRLNPQFASLISKVSVQTHLEFQRQWGLGSSSTLINNIAQWAEVDAYRLLFDSFGGSGYDIACAQHDTPIIYRLDHKQPTAYPVTFSPDFLQNIYFVYLNQKQDSKQGITRYRTVQKGKKTFISRVSEITQECIRTSCIEVFCELLNAHEDLVAHHLKLPKAKDLYFSDFDGSIKSLGAWGGDFVMAVTKLDAISTQKYFSEKGFDTVIPYEEMILGSKFI